MDHADFVSEMYVAVIEESYLFEIMPGATDHLGDGAHVVHGPWPPDECSAVMLAWFDRRWIALHRSPDDDAPLPHEYARQVLSDPMRWTQDNPEGLLSLRPADSAPDDYGHWCSAVPAPTE